MQTQNEINSANENFWDELCGSTFAQSLGIKDRSSHSLEKFDYEYFRYYPYLLKHVPAQNMKGKKVLEVGLGYGTLGLKLAQAGADYTGLDIAQGPVDMMNHRLKLFDLSGKAIKGSILQCPLKNQSMDYVVSIGCYHHTGNLQRCFDETYRVLKPGGTAVIMLYNQFSYKQWVKWPKATLQALWRDLGVLKPNLAVSEDQKAAYDLNIAGDNAPETVFSSIKQLKKMLSKFSKVDFAKENCDDHRWPITRRVLLPWLGKSLGLDIYLRAYKD